jgi:autotransporter strand-loop-strand O-heptosyltransferase
MEYVRNNDAVVYEYSEGSTKENNPYSSAYIFSIKTDIAMSVINLINSKEEYFKNKPDSWQLEKVLFQSIKKITNSIFVSKYIPNNDELNIFAAWNRNGILRNGAIFQTYLATDLNQNLYVHFISGFNEKLAKKDYMVEIVYDNKSTFYVVKKGQYQLQQIGKYKKGETIQVFYQGVEVFSENLSENYEDFYYKNKIELSNQKSNRKVNINFIDGPYVEITDDIILKYNIKFINKKNNKVEYELDLESNRWAKCNKKYYIDWLIQIRGIDNDFEHDYHFTTENKRFLISFESKSLGDNLAFIPYVEKFRKENKCRIVCSTFHNDVFKKEYPEIEFISPGSNVHNINGLYRLGLFYDQNKKIDYDRHPINPLKEPLQKIASDILGLDYEEIKPKIPSLGNKKKKRVCIAIHSTAQCKYWNNPNGWQDVVNYLKGKGYEVRLLSREEDGYMGNKNPIGVIQQPPTDTKGIIKILQESEYFIGISSGLSWLAWASNIPVVLISGFTDIYLEPFDGIKRIINTNVCNSCWHDHEFDPGDWNWCPIHKGTEQQFECSKEITSENVISILEKMN